MENEILKLETQGWQALSSSEGHPRDFYRIVLHEDAVMVFPGGIRLRGRQAILDSFSTEPWSSFEIKDPQVIHIRIFTGF